MPSKANPAELAIINMTRAEKRLSILPILFEEGNYADIVDESAAIVRSAVSSLVCDAGMLPDSDEQLIAQFEQLDELDSRAREHAVRIVEIHDEVTQLEQDDAPPEREAAAELIEWATFLTRLCQQVVKELDAE